MHANTTDNYGIEIMYQNAVTINNIQYPLSCYVIKDIVVNPTKDFRRYSRFTKSKPKNNSSRSLAGQPRIHVLMVRSCDHIQHQVPSSGDLDGLVWQLRCERQGRVHQILGQLLRGLLCLLCFDRFGFHTQPHVNLSRKKERKWRMR